MLHNMKKFPSDARNINIDLHCHSNVSDGTLTPVALVERAHARGVAWLSLTDHDEISGLPAAAARAADLGLGFIHGVEISVSWAGQTVHILGLHIDPTHADLRAGLERTRSGREQRAREISEELTKVGIPDAYAGAVKYADHASTISRLHFARYLVELGVADNISQVFQRYLVRGRPGFVPHRWARLEDALRWIRDARGMAVVAHPGRYVFDELKRRAFFEAFISAGGEGIEIMTSAHTPDEVQTYLKLARHYGLKGSRGSDFHDPNESPMDLGELPPLPSFIEPVWAQWGL